MAQLSYSFCMSLLHSIWQAGLLLLLYRLLEISLQEKFTPLQKKNFLFISLGVQAVLLFSTFFIYYYDAENDFANSIITKKVNSVLSSNGIHAITPWLFSLYLVVTAGKMAKTVYDWYGFKNSFRAGMQKPGIDLKLFTALKADHFGIKRKVQLWYSSTINTPLTFGFFKPIIILPLALVNQLSLPQAEALILHELTHIQSNDHLLNWLLLVAENIFFFNPFLLSLCKKIRLEREKYCDINVMAFDYAPLVYAETLLRAQHIKQNFSHYHVAAVGKKQELLHRISFFTSTKNHISKNNNRFIIPLMASLLLLILGAALFFQFAIAKSKLPAVEQAVVPVNEVSAETAPAFVNNIIKNLTEEKLKDMVAAVEKQQPAIEKQIKKLAPLIKTIENKAATIADEMNDNMMTPVVLEENDATRQIVVREEESGSKNATVKVYTLSFVNGKWVLQPEWKLAAKEIPATDSLRKIMDTTTTAKDQQPAY